MKPTPGPWKLDLEALQIGLPVQEIPGEYAWIELDGAYDFFLNDIPEEELQADARLIAAAPDLLEAAMYVIDKFRYIALVDAEVNEVLQRVYQVVRKVVQE